MDFVGHFRMIKHSDVSIRTCVSCYRITCDANALDEVNKGLNL